jgi:hypothetical protein
MPANAPRLGFKDNATVALYITTGGQGTWASEPPIAHALSQSVASSRAAAGGVQHLALDFMGFLRC